MKSKLGVGLLAVATLFLSTGAAWAQAVRHVFPDLPIGTTNGPPTCALGPSGRYLHVVYSRNDKPTRETRADIFYRRIDLSTTPPTPSDEVCLTAGEGDFDETNLGLASPDKTVKNTSFHMCPRIAVDSTGRVHVLFAGFGDLRDGWSSYYLTRYNTKLAYLSFMPDSVLDGGKPDFCDWLVDNSYDQAFDDLQHPDQYGTYTGCEYSRMAPNLTLEEKADGSVYIHATFASASEYWEGISWSTGNLIQEPADFRISYLRFRVDGGVPVADSMERFNLDKATGEGSMGDVVIFYAQPGIRAYPMPDGRVQVFAAFEKDLDGDTKDSILWGHYIVDPADGSVDSIYSDWGRGGFRPLTGIDSQGRLHVAGGIPGGAELVFPLPTATNPHPAPEAVTAGFTLPFNFTEGGVLLDGTLYGLTDGPTLQFLDRSAGTPVFLSYAVAQVGAPGEYCDLTVRNTDDGPLFYAVYATGVNDQVAMYNDWQCGAAHNLFLSVFRKPDPATDCTAWISQPTEGQTVYVQKKAHGEITLAAVKAAPDGESYTWYDGDSGKELGTGQTLTTAFPDGVNRVKLYVERLLADGNTVTDEDSVSFRVETYTGNAPPPPPTPGITVSPASLSVPEGGPAGSVTIVLDTQPSQDVTITPSFTDSNQAGVSPATLLFTSSNWNVPQKVTVTPVDDSVQEGDQTYEVTMTTSSADANYDGIAAPQVSVTIVDDDGSTTPTTTTYQSTDGEIPILDGTTIDSTMHVSDSYVLSGMTVTLSFKGPTSDLEAWLSHNGGTPVPLFGAGECQSSVTVSGFDGANVCGDWVLTIRDTKTKKTATLTGWSLTVGSDSGSTAMSTEGTTRMSEARKVNEGALHRKH